jgi:hypothetical protein
MRVNGEMIERMAKNTELREKGSVEVTVVEMSRKRLDPCPPYCSLPLPNHLLDPSTLPIYRSLSPT